MYSYVIIWSFILISGSISHTTPSWRVKRQTGYNYNRPTVPFDLPTKSPASATPNLLSTPRPTNPAIAPNQEMYYAYPAPTSGFPSSTLGVSPSISTTPTPYAYSTPVTTLGSSTSNYNYPRPASPTPGLPTYTPPASESSSSTGYPTPSSTKGPKYLPPLETPSSTKGPPYLPPKIDNPSSTQMVIIVPDFSDKESISNNEIQITSSASYPSLPSNNYIPPTAGASQSSSEISPSNQYGVPSSTISSSTAVSSSSLSPSNSYIPPSSTESSVTIGNQPISTPASTYLPPF